MKQVARAVGAKIDNRRAVGRNALVHNVGACSVAGIGGLGNEAKRNAKTDQLRLVPRHNINKENKSYEDTEPGYCTSTVLAVVPFTRSHSVSNSNF